MYISYIILIISLSIIIILNIVSIKRKNKVIKKLEEVKSEELKDVFKERWDKEEQGFKLKQTELQIKEKELSANISKLQSILAEKEKRYEEVNQDLDLYREGKIKEIDGAAAEYEQRRQLIVDKGIEEYRALTNDFFNAELDLKNQQLEQINKDLDLIRSVLEEERRKRDAVNEEILRQRKIAEKQDFFKIQINPNDKQDIELLKSITPKLRHPEAINKVIWTGYYQKPLAELRKRAGIESSGVYKITRLKTGEIYIGQAVNVSTRWADHCKTALGVGTLASSQLHRVMATDGPEEFTFEVIEEVERDKLRERESFYIDFYDSKNYGLNTVSGDKNK